ncbi:MAG TPA: carboxypeptidase-like regulatory domain-containing protein [Blastocatellia bacterium]|nr:carboxypeptidase-like regulatory domain-containing protein [Blastocatellia bacterium]
MTSQFRTSLVIALLAALFGLVPAQSPDKAQASSDQTQANAARIGSLRGRVTNSDGQPMANVTVNISPIGRAAGRRPGMPGGAVQTITDDEGNFQVDGLLPASYAVSSAAPGYVTLPPEDENSAGIYHPGDSVLLTLVKGGVITGKVMNSAGEPLTGVSVNAIRVGNVDGEADATPAAAGFGRNWRTNDLGLWRIYGLVPGSYIVQAGGRSGGPNQFSEFSEDAPTFYPSSVRDAAVILTVRAGEEVSGIDIRYRGEKGRTVSGRVVARTESGFANFGGIQISLRSAASGAQIATTMQMDRGNSRGFALYGIPDGDYEIVARRSGFNPLESDEVSAPRRVSVRGADVSGLELTLAPLATVSGKVIIEKKPGAPAAACQPQRASFIEEVLLTAQRDEAAREALSPDVPRPAAPAANGEFLLRNLEAGRWRINALLPGESWYVRAISLSKAPASAPVRKTAAATQPSAASVINVARDGFSLRAGEKLKGLTVTLAEGAASLKGKVVTDGAKPAGRIGVYLVPAEKESADDLLRYALAGTRSDGSFQFSHFAPGRYYLLAGTMPEAGSSGSALSLSALDNTRRATLRREAEARGIAIDLSPCQRVTDYQFRTAGAFEIRK